jgi:hypothetical protein
MQAPNGTADKRRRNVPDSALESHIEQLLLAANLLPLPPPPVVQEPMTQTVTLISSNGMSMGKIN